MAPEAALCSTTRSSFPPVSSSRPVWSNATVVTDPVWPPKRVGSARPEEVS